MLPNNAEGYPLLYVTCNGSVLCADCATDEWNDKEFGTMETDEGQVYWEGDTLQCDTCSEEIESAYGPLK